MQLVLIAVGGAVWALMRYGVLRVAAPSEPGTFPAHTFIVNVSGAFLVGLLATLLLERTNLSVDVRAGILIGGLGAYTTFSAFSLETLQLLEDGKWPLAFMYVTASVLGALAAVWVGQSLARA